jgi:pseudaminic acid synthase
VNFSVSSADSPAHRIAIGDLVVGQGLPAMVVAELSANHLGSLDTALRTMEAAAEAGADAVKLQTYTPDTITLNSSGELFRVRGGTAWDGRTLYDLYAEAQTPWEWHAPLFAKARELGIVCFSSPFDPSAVDFLESIEAPAYKIASFEITDTPLIERVAATGKPVIISTGVASEQDIRSALAAGRRCNNLAMILLKCTSAYPAPLAEVNLRTMVDMQQRFQTLVGFSDHTLSHSAAMVAIALGAVIIEKHVTLDRKLGGPDSSFSIEPKEFAEMIRLIREVEALLGEVTYDLGPVAETHRQFTRSLFVSRDVIRGEFIDESNVRSVRPGAGLRPAEFASIRGRRFVRDVPAATPMSWDLIE